MANLFLGGEIPPGFQAVPKMDADGKLLYLLPQSSSEVPGTVSKTVKSATVSANPSMVTEKVPMNDGAGIQRTYEMTQTVVSEAGVISQVGTGVFLPLWTTAEIQEKNDKGKLLYWNTVEEPIINYAPQLPLEITQDDLHYIDGLEQAYELVALPPEPSAPLLPPTPETRIASLEKENKKLKDQLTSTSTDLQGFMDYYFSKPGS